ncbi:hypothetical protein ONZ45_g8799 [Pleurotus djamor]|nr:hypothetical protein ONZ45_g8799 [Pleurotus djamor]
MTIITAEDVAGQTFDYIIAGGGTAGLVVAARLSEDPTVTVLVIEAGPANLNDEMIRIPAQYGAHFGKPSYDWNLETGNPGWNWSNYSHYLNKAENYVPLPCEELSSRGICPEEWKTSGNGPLSVGHSHTILDIELKAARSLESLGVKPASNPPDGFAYLPNTVNPLTNERTYSAAAYYEPNKHRPNLQVLVEANVNRIISQDGKNGEIRATGVEITVKGCKYVVLVGLEVIVCAGATKSPQILELSGIGKKDILDSIGVPLKVNLPGVGENLQEVGSSEISDAVPGDTFDLLSDPAEVEKNLALRLEGKGLCTMSFSGFSFNPLSRLSDRHEAIQESIEKLVLDTTSANPGIHPPCPGKRYFTFLAASNYLFSRGNIHAVSNDPAKSPAIDPRYFSNEIDLNVFLEIIKFIRRLAATPPFSDILAEGSSELNPGRSVASDEDLIIWLKKHMASTFHPAGTCGMRPREDDGVVDPQLRVYGTENIRVVDMSIIPLHFCCHPQGELAFSHNFNVLINTTPSATVYALAEQAVDSQEVLPDNIVSLINLTSSKSSIALITNHSGMPIASIQDVADQTFDFVIAGGGTAGLVVAARLSEDPGATVLVVEAGPANLRDDMIRIPSQHSAHFGRAEYDWNLETLKTQQGNTLNKRFPWHIGKGLGGSSAINFMCWTKPAASDIDGEANHIFFTIELLNDNPGWNWSNYTRYLEKAEKYTPLPVADLSERAIHPGCWESFGRGPLMLAHTRSVLDIELKAMQSLENLGVTSASEPMGGNAYFEPNKERPNFQVLVGTNVNKIISNNNLNGTIRATGVELYTQGRKYVVHVRREVIVCAGATKSPQILELSGIGNRSILKSIGIPVKVDLPGVGENLQEHICTGVSYEIADSIPGDTFDGLSDPDELKKHMALWSEGKGVFTLGFSGASFNPLSRLSDKHEAILHSAQQLVSDLAPSISKGLRRHAIDRRLVTLPAFLQILYHIYLFVDPPQPGKRYFTIVAVSHLLFSRGTIHAVSSDPTASPTIDPRYCEREIGTRFQKIYANLILTYGIIPDLEVLLEAVKFARKIGKTPPFSEVLAEGLNELNPGSSVQSDEDLRLI